MAKSRKSDKEKDTGAQSDDPQDVLETQLTSEDTDASITDSTEELAEPEQPAEDVSDPDEGKPVEEAAVETSDDATAEVETDVSEEATEETRQDDELAETESPAEDAMQTDAETSDTPDTEEAETLEITEDTTDAEDTSPEDQEATDAEVDEDKTDTSSDSDETLVDADEHKVETADAEPVEIEEKPAPAPEPKPEPEIVRGSMWPAVFGGVIAAGVGFIAGRGDVLDQYLPASMQRETVDVAAIEEQLATQVSASVEEQLAARVSAAIEEQLSAQMSAVEAQAARLNALEAASGPDLSGALAALESEIAAISSKVAGLEAAPAEPAAPSVNPEEVTALQDAIAAQEAQLAALTERATAAEANAETEAARILASAALLNVVTSMDSGEPFTAALAELESVTPVEVPAALSAAAETGVPTMAMLQDTFPDAARAALSAARSGIPDGEAATITNFLQRQLNVRSVVPREGDNADAVLSRAEAAVRSGDIALALTELEGLPDAAGSAMDEWIEAATARQAAKDAANALADGLSSN